MSGYIYLQICICWSSAPQSHAKLWTLYDWLKFRRNELHIHLPRKRMGSKGMLLWPPQSGSSFFVPSNERKVWLVSWSENTPGAQHTGWDLLFERTFRGGHYTTNPNSARFFRGKSLQNTYFGIKFLIPPSKKGGISWSLEFPKLDPPNAERLSWKKNNILTRTSKTTMFAGSGLPKMFFSPTHHRLA